MSSNEYISYIRQEWDMFLRDPVRRTAMLDMVQGKTVRRVLDIGCGAGQELTPFTANGVFGVGIDIDAEAGQEGRRLFAQYDDKARVAFACASGEHLPFAAGCFDMLICRVALPYMDNRQALSEMARVVKPDGVLLLKIHHWRYYVRKCASGLRAGDLLSMIHSLRVLSNGILYHLLGKQFLRKPIGKETFQTAWLLRRELPSFVIRGEMPDSNPLTPCFVIVKAQS